MHPRFFLFSALTLLLVATVGLGIASAQQRSLRYVGPVNHGGTIKLVVSSNGKMVTSFTLTKVQTPCAKITATVTSKLLVKGNSFAYTVDPMLKLKGMFNASKTKASGTLGYKDPNFASCGGTMKWTASRR